MVLDRITNLFLEKKGFGQKTQLFPKEKVGFGLKNKLFPRKKMVLGQKTNFVLGKPKKHLLGNYTAKLQRDGFLVFPWKKFVFWWKNQFFPGKKMVLDQNTMFFLGKIFLRKKLVFG